MNSKGEAGYNSIVEMVREGLTFRFYKSAILERITGETWLAGTRWHVIDHLTKCIDSTTSGTGILAFGSDASFVSVAITGHDALGSTTRVRITVEIWSAGACSWVEGLATYCVWTAGRALARSRLWWQRLSYKGGIININKNKIFYFCAWDRNESCNWQGRYLRCPSPILLILWYVVGHRKTRHMWFFLSAEKRF